MEDWMTDRTGKRVSARGLALCLAALAAAAFATPCRAATLQVDPVRLQISTDRKTVTVTVTNAENRPVTIRVYPIAWSQANGEDVYADTEKLIISPPVATIAGGGHQLLRIGLRSADADHAAYRLMIEEIPAANPGGGIQVALRLNLPLFADIAQGKDSSLAWAAWKRADGKWVIEAANPGDSYVRVEAPAIRSATGIAPPQGIAFAVVLPRSSRRWVVGAAPAVENRAAFQRITHADPGDISALALIHH
jgi:fimbrial chaperone protein